MAHCFAVEAKSQPSKQPSSNGDASWQGYMQTIEDMERRILALDPRLAQHNNMHMQGEVTATRAEAAAPAAHAAQHLPDHAQPHAASAMQAPDDSDGAAKSTTPERHQAVSASGVRSPRAGQGRAALQSPPPRMHAIGDDRVLRLQTLADAQSPGAESSMPASVGRHDEQSLASPTQLVAPLIELHLR